MSSFDWRTATPQEVDLQYSPSQFGLRPLDEYLDEYAGLSSQVDARELAQPNNPLLIYIHGGYWQKLSAEHSLFNGADALAEGVALHAVEYTLAPEATVEAIIHECLLDVLRVITELTPTRVVIAGCSAGAHLAAMCARDAVIAPLLHGAALLSGIYDLRPLVVTTTNDALHLDENSATRISPHLLGPSSLLSHALLAVGRHESSEFIRQNAEYAKHLQSVGTQTDCAVIEDRDHFNLPYDLLRRGTQVGDWVLARLQGEST